MNPIRVAIAGYGNLGRGAELALTHCPDMELVAVFSRRASLEIATPHVPVVPLDQADAWREKVDVVILCGGSATDLPEQCPRLARLFHTVDSFDTHARIPEYFAQVDKAAREGGHVSIISVGWDPGLFSLSRLYGEAILPQSTAYTFWGRGVSQGHSDALRRIPGVQDAIQYTVPVASALEAVRAGTCPQLTTRQKHTRECFVVAQEGSDKAAIEQAAKTMPNYFDDYDTTVTFITQEELERDHRAMPHGGFVIRSGHTGQDTSQVMEFSLRLGSNPQFTASVLVAYARAAWRLAGEGAVGARTVLDIPPAALSPKTGGELRAQLL